MGDFVGHVGPAIYILMFSTWWLYNIFRDFFASIGYRRPTKVSPHNNANQLPTFRSRIWYADSLCHRMPLEIAAKIFLSLLPIIIKYSTPGEVSVHDFHHTIIELTYSVDGLVDLMVHYKWPLPKHSDTASYIFQVVMQLLVFESHQYGKTPFGQALHRYIIWIFCVLVLFASLQSMFRSNATLAILRAFTFQLYGTWLIQVGFLLEPISEIDVFHWQTKSQGEQMMIIGFLFAVHFLANVLIVFVFGTVVCFAAKKPIEYQHHNGCSKNAQHCDSEPLLSTNIDKNNNGTNVTNGSVIAFG